MKTVGSPSLDQRERMPLALLCTGCMLNGCFPRGKKKENKENTTGNKSTQHFVAVRQAAPPLSPVDGVVLDQTA